MASNVCLHGMKRCLIAVRVRVGSSARVHLDAPERLRLESDLSESSERSVSLVPVVSSLSLSLMRCQDRDSGHLASF